MLEGREAEEEERSTRLFGTEEASADKQPRSFSGSREKLGRGGKRKIVLGAKGEGGERDGKHTIFPHHHLDLCFSEGWVKQRRNKNEVYLRFRTAKSFTTMMT